MCSRYGTSSRARPTYDVISDRTRCRKSHKFVLAIPKITKGTFFYYTQQSVFSVPLFVSKGEEGNITLNIESDPFVPTCKKRAKNAYVRYTEYCMRIRQGGGG